MRITQFSLEEFNPDGMCSDEIEQWIAFIGSGQRPRVAKQWFPSMKDQFRHTRNIRNYLWNKLTAINCRLSGKIQEAMQYEAICDRIYKELPESAKW